MDLESISPESIEAGPPPPRNSPFPSLTLRGRLPRRKKRGRREQKTKTKEEKERVLAHKHSAGELSWPRPTRKSLKGIKGTSFSKDEAVEYTKRWRKSLSEPLEQELSRKGSGQSLPVDTMKKLVSSVGLRKVQVSRESKEEAYKIGFNVFNKTDDELVTHVDKMVDCFALLPVFKSRRTLHNLVAGIRTNYKSNPFHNFKHAFGVAHMAVVFILRDLAVAKALGKRKILAFIVAALGHDLNHPGNDNSFEIALDSQLVRDYTREAVLENFHAHNLLGLLKDPENNVFQHLLVQKQQEIFTFIVEAVLGTDMKQHSAHVEYLSRTTDFHTAIRSRIYRRGLTSAIMHACDLSGQCVDLEVAVDWEARISAEFRNQAMMLKQSHKEVPQRLQDLEDARKRAGLQLDFIDTFLEPLWAQIARCMPSMEGLYNNLTQVVRVYYKTLYKHGEGAAELFYEQYRSKKLFSSSGKFILNMPKKGGERESGGEARVIDNDNDCEVVEI